MTVEAKHITIVGTGLIGGSLGLALKAAGLDGVQIAGHDRDRGSANKAERMGAIDRAEHNMPRAVAGAAIVIIATPVRAVREVMEQIAPDLAAGVVVTDTASTKAQVMQWARELLPSHVSFVGGHPMAGKETQGIDHADATLFQGKAYCVCPSVTASEAAVRSVTGLARLIGAEPLFIDPDEHDQYAAAVSHLPLMISTALFDMLQSSPAWPDMAPMASSGFRDVTRLASGDPAMSHDIWVTNREALIHWLGRLEKQLEKMRGLLQDADDRALLQTFTRAQMERDAFLAGPPKRRGPEDIAAPEARKTFLDMLVGGMVAERMRKIEKLPEMAAEAAWPGPKGEEPKHPSLAERIAEDVRRDLEKLEKKRTAKERESESNAEN